MKHIYSQNYKTEKEYYKALDEEILPVVKGYKLNDDDILRRYVIMKIMCDFEIDIESVEQKFKIDFNKYFEWGLNNLERNGSR